MSENTVPSISNSCLATEGDSTELEPQTPPGSPLATPPGSPPALSDHHASVPVKGTQKAHRVCYVCGGVHLYGDISWQKHIQGKRHLRLLQGAPEIQHTKDAFTCTVCGGVQLLGEENWKKHVQGRKHLRRIKDKALRDASTNQEVQGVSHAISDGLNDPQDGTNKAQGGNTKNGNKVAVGIADIDECSDCSTVDEGDLTDEEGEPQGICKQAKGQPKYCNICKVTLRGQQAWDKHINGRKHTRKAQGIVLSQTQKNGEHSAQVNLEENERRCTVCNVTVMGETNWNNHTAGAKHQRKLHSLGLTIQCPLCEKEEFDSNTWIVHINSQEHLDRVNAGSDGFQHWNLTPKQKKEREFAMQLLELVSESAEVRRIKDHLEHVESVLNSEAKKVVCRAATSDEGNNVMHHAALQGRVNVLSLLLEVSASVNSVNMEGVTPLHAACSKGHTDAVNFLLNFENSDLEPVCQRKALLKVKTASGETTGQCVNTTISGTTLAKFNELVRKDSRPWFNFDKGFVTRSQRRSLIAHYGGMMLASNEQIEKLEALGQGKPYMSLDVSSVCCALVICECKDESGLSEGSTTLHHRKLKKSRKPTISWEDFSKEFSQYRPKWISSVTDALLTGNDEALQKFNPGRQISNTKLCNISDLILELLQHLQEGLSGGLSQAMVLLWTCFKRPPFLKRNNIVDMNSSNIEFDNSDSNLGSRNSEGSVKVCKDQGDEKNNPMIKVLATKKGRTRSFWVCNVLKRCLGSCLSPSAAQALDMNQLWASSLSNRDKCDLILLLAEECSFLFTSFDALDHLRRHVMDFTSRTSSVTDMTSGARILSRFPDLQNTPAITVIVSSALKAMVVEPLLQLGAGQSRITRESLVSIIASQGTVCAMRENLVMPALFSLNLVDKLVSIWCCEYPNEITMATMYQSILVTLVSQRMCVEASFIAQQYNQWRFLQALIANDAILQTCLEAGSASPCRPVFPQLDRCEPSLSSEFNIMWVDSVGGAVYFFKKCLELSNQLLAVAAFDLEWRDPRPASCLQVAFDGTVYVICLLPGKIPELVKLPAIPGVAPASELDYFGLIGRAMALLFNSMSVVVLGFEMEQDVMRLTTVCPEAHLGTAVNIVDMRNGLRVCSKISEIGEDLTKVAGSSLANLANTVLGSPLSKQEQVSNWDRRPLLPQQLHYAALDSEALVRIWFKLPLALQNMLLGSP